MTKKRGLLQYIFLTLFISLGLNPLFAQDNEKSAAKLEQDAKECFENQDYQCAKEFYSQLTTFYPKDPNFNYRFGACMLFVDKDKNYPLKFLEYAVSRPNVDPEAFYYLARGYHYNYRFREAINYYEKYKAKGTPKMQKKLEVDMMIRQCKNGLHLLSNISEPIVNERKKLNESDFYLAYKLDDIGGRVLRAPEELRSSVDKKMGYYPLMYRNKNEDIIFFSSYGNDKKNGIDIFSVSVTGDGKLSDPYRLSNDVNTPYDDAFPFMSKNGTDFYFASKGHNSMGGYDIFHIKYDPLTNTWGPAENLDYAINTPDNDFMYAISESGGYAYFSSDRNLEAGKAYVYKIEPGRKPLQFTILTGKFTSINTKSAKIMVEDLNKKEFIGSFSAEKDNGTYVMKLENGGSYRFYVEPFGSDVTYIGNVTLPNLKELRPLKQEMEIVTENGEDKLIIRNLFEEKPTMEDEILLSQQLLAAADIGQEQTDENVKDIALSNEEVLVELDVNRKTFERNAADLAGKAGAAYQLAIDKKAIARQDLDLSKQIAQSINEEDFSEEAEAKRQEVAQLQLDAKQHLIEAKGTLALADALNIAVNNEQTKALLASEYHTKTTSSVATNNREEVVTTYLEYSEKLNKIPESEDFDQIVRNLDALARHKKQRADEIMAEAEGIKEQEDEIDKDIEYYKKQLNQTKDKELRTALEGELNDLELEKEKAITDKTFKFSEARSLYAESEDFEKQVEAIQALSVQIAEANNAAALQSINIAVLADDIAELNTEINAIEGPAPEVLVGGAVASGETGSTESTGTTGAAGTTETSETATTVSTFIARDGEGNALPIDAKVIEEKESPYAAYYKKELETVAAENEDDEFELIRSAIAINSDWKRDIDTEIAYTQKYLDDNPDAGNKKKVANKLSSLQMASAKKQEEIDGAMTALQDMSTEVTENGPDKELLIYASVNDLENKYYVPYSETDFIDDESARLSKINELNTEYIEDAKAAIFSLEQANAGLPIGSAEFDKNNSEIAALEEVIATKQKGVADNHIILAELQPDAAQDDDSKQETVTETTTTAGTTADEVTETTETATGEELAETTETGTSDEKPFEGYVESENSGTVVVSGTLVPLVITSETGKREYAEEEVRDEPVTLSEAAYNQEYANQFAENSNNPDILDKAKVAQKINYDWLVATEKEIATLEYVQATTDNADYAAQLGEKIDQLELQAGQKRSQLTLNAMLIKQLEAQELAAADTSTENAGIQQETEETTLDEQADTGTATRETATAGTDEGEVATESSTETATATEVAAGGVVAGGVTGVESTTQTGESASDETALTETATTDDVSTETATEAVVTPETGDELAQDTETGQAETATETGTEAPSSTATYVYPEPSSEPVAEVEREQETQVANIAAKEAELAAVQEELSLTKKKKKRLPLEEQVKTRQAEVRYEKRKEELLDDRAQKIAQAQQLLYEDPFAVRLSSDLYAEADFRKDEYELKDEQLVDLKNTIGETKKKKKRKELEKQVPELESAVKLAELEADMALQTAMVVERAEDQTLMESTPYGKEIIVKLPEHFRVLTVEEQTEITETPEFRAYDEVKADFTVKTKEAEVLYLSARKKENQGKDLVQNAINLYGAIGNLPVEEQFDATEKADEMKKRGDDLLSEAHAEKMEAIQLENEAYYNMNKANEELLAVTDPVLRNNIISVVTGAAEVPILTADNVDSIPEVLTYEIFLKADTAETTSFYDETKPIPIDEPLPEGLIFKVQIGAFRLPIKQETFKGFAPIVGERTPSGLTKYTAGLFKTFPTANDAKQGIRDLGYSDAFVVAYLNGKRISITEARRMTGDLPPILTVNETGQTVTVNPVTGEPETSSVTGGTTGQQGGTTGQQGGTTGQQGGSTGQQGGTTSGTANVQQGGTTSDGTATAQAPIVNYEITEDVELPVETQETRILTNESDIPEVRSIKEQPDLFFTIQIGVFSAEVSPDKLFNITPLNSDVTPSGLIRYSTGVYPSVAEAASARSRIIQIGIRDAFVTAYYNGQRIPVSEAIRLGRQGGAPVIVTTPPEEEVEVEAPLEEVLIEEPVFEEEVSEEPIIETETPVETTTETPVETTTEVTGKVFKVMVGPYEGNVPVMQAATILQMNSLGVELAKEGDITYYKIGRYATRAEAEELQVTLIERGLANPVIVEE